MRKAVQCSLPLSGICLALASLASAGAPPARAEPSLVSRRAPAAHAATGYVINVKDFGAMGDGQTDDTAAIQQAVEAANKGTFAMSPIVGTGSTPLLYFPPGHYMISDEIRFGGYPNVGSDNKAIIEQTDKTKRIFAFAGSYQVEVHGLRFVGGKNQIYYANSNLDMSTVNIDNCEFTLSSDYAIYTEGTAPGDSHLSCLLTVSRSKFVYPNKVLRDVCDDAIVRDCWVQIGSRNFDKNSAAFLDAGNLYFDNMFGVPDFNENDSHVRWIDEIAGGRLVIDRSRFGGENAGIPAIYYFSKPPTSYPFMGGQVTVTNSQLSVGAANRPDSGVLVLAGGVPQLVIIEGNGWLIDAPYVRTAEGFDLKKFMTAYPNKSQFNIKIGPNMECSGASFPEELMQYLKP